MKTVVYVGSFLFILAGTFGYWGWLRGIQKRARQEMEENSLAIRELEKPRTNERVAQRLKWEATVELMTQDEIDDMMELFDNHCCNWREPYQSSYDIPYEYTYALYHELAALHRKYRD